MHANLSILREWSPNMSVLEEEVLAFGLFSFSLYIAPEIQNTFKLWSNIQTQEVQKQKFIIFNTSYLLHFWLLLLKSVQWQTVPSCSLSLANVEKEHKLWSSPLDNIEPLCFAEALPPTFLTRPESITTFVGKSAKFLCTVSGTPVIDVAWQKDGTTISPSDHHKISKVENKHVLEISLLTTSDRGIYTCKASNKFGADICQAEMVIIDKPHFTKVLQSVQSAVNKKIRLECQVDEDRKVTVGWTKDGNKIPPGKDYKIYFEDKIASLEIPLAKLKDSGHYVCTASNEAGSSSSSASVTVRGKIVLHPPYLCSSWVPHFFFCRSKTSLGWNHTGTLLRPAIRSIHLLLISPAAFQHTVCCLKISSTSHIQELLLHAGKRWMEKARETSRTAAQQRLCWSFLKSCFVLTLGTNLSKLCISTFFPFSLFFSPFLPLFFPFLEPPSFVKKVDPSYLLTPGDSARLQCKIKGSPEIQVTWFKNNKEIRESNTHRMSFVNSVAVLDILEMKVDDSGSYSCEAVNEVGSDSCTTEVVVKGLFFLLLPVTFLRKTFLSGLFVFFFLLGMVD